MRCPLSAVAVDGDSMAPTLQPGDLLLVARTARILPGDLIMARRPDRPGLLLVKRVLGRERGGWWIEGDNPAGSDDSRLFGPLPGECVLGRVLFRYWPPPAVRSIVPVARSMCRW